MTSLPEPRLRPALVPTRWPWWAQVLAIYGLTRVWTTVVLLVAASGQPESYWGAARPDYWTFVGRFWDASWYQSIAEHGYPASLPLDEGGAVMQNAWAFFPLFPGLVRGLMEVTRAPWDVVAPVTATLLGAAAMLVIAELVESQARRRGHAKARSLALGTVLLVGVFPSSPVLQVAYTESLTLLLVATVLTLLVRRSYGWGTLAVLALGLSRAVAMPMAAVVAVHLVWRWRESRAGRDRLSRTDVVGAGAMAAGAVVGGLAWPAIAGLVTGVPDAYLRTQAAWRGSFSMAPVVPWFEMASYLFGPPGLIVLAALAVGLLALGLARKAGLAGPELQAWGLAYPAWLVVAVFPQSSTFRFLLLAFPLGTATVALAPTRTRMAVVTLCFAAGQWLWVMWLWQLTTPTAWPP